MIPRSFTVLLASCVAAILVGLTPPVVAQDDDISVLADKALLAMNQEKWKDSLDIHTQVVTQFGKNNTMQLYGPRFGTLYYRKGICELKLKKWEDALQSFEICYRDFPNAGHPGGGNLFHEMALLKWAEAAMGAEEWELALRKFQQFIKECDKTRDKFSMGSFHIGMAICQYQLGRFADGNTNLELAIHNKLAFETPEAGIIAGVHALATGAIFKHNERVLVDFIQKNRGDLVTAPYTMQQFSRVFMQLAGDALEEDMVRAALALYQFVPSTDDAIDDIRVRLKSMGVLQNVADGANSLSKKKLEEDLATLIAERDGKGANEILKLAAIAYIHEKNCNLRGAFAAYEQLELYYPVAAKREHYLFQLVRTSSVVDPAVSTRKYADVFIKDFPNSTHVPTVRRLLLSALFYSGEFTACIEVASAMIDKVAPGSLEHDMCLHMLGGSYFNTGQYDKAQPLLDEHLDKYPQTPFLIEALYFRASNLSHLQYWSKASALLDEFIKAYPNVAENIYLPFALYDRATCHFSENQCQQAIDVLTRVIKEFPTTNVVDQAYNLLGSVEQALGHADKAESAYLSGLTLATTRMNRLVIDEALFSLVSLLGEKKSNRPDNPRLKDAVPYADRFWNEHAKDSQYEVRVAVAQVAALDSVGRGEEALERLRKVISGIAKDPEAAGIEELINSYTIAYLEKHSLEELKEHYYNFPGINTADRGARALLRVAVIGAFESVAKKSQDENRKRTASAMIKVLFQELKADFALKDLTNFILVKVGDFVRLNTSSPRDALPYYDEAINRPNLAYRFTALLGRAEVYANSTAAADLDKGIVDFTRIYADSKDKSERELALFRMIELLMAKREFAKAADHAKIYLDRAKTGFTKYAPMAGLLLARSFEERQMPDDAIAMYVKVWSAHLGNIKISAPAMISWMRLSWDRNNPATGPDSPGDRQGAYLGGMKYLELTGRFKNKMTAPDLALWQVVENLTKGYEADPQIKSLETLKREKEAAKK